MADKTAVCVDCGQTDLREHMIKSPRGFVHTFTRRCQSTWQSQVEAADNERNAALTRAEAAEKRVKELEAQLAAQWRSVSEPPTDNGDYLVYCWPGEYEAMTFWDGYWAGGIPVYHWQPLPAPPQDTPASGRRQYNQDKS